ncbi:hypothetical protein ACPCG0_07240 [Propionibacteriaceae bacterium Y1923]
MSLDVTTDQRTRPRPVPRARSRGLGLKLAILAVVMVASALGSSWVGRYPVGPDVVLDVLFSRLGWSPVGCGGRCRPPRSGSACWPSAWPR